MNAIGKYKVKIILIGIIITVSSLGAYFSSASNSFIGRTFKLLKIDPNVEYQVTKIVDGDTFDIKVGTKTVRVRMLGVDTPETVDPRKIVQCFGKEASKMSRELLGKHKVTLKTDSTQSTADKFNRLLAYVYRDDGLFINQYLLKNGYAHEYTYGVPYEKQKEFKEMEKVAREGKKGLWGEICTKP